MSKSSTFSKSSISVLKFSWSLYLCNHFLESIHTWTKGTLPYPTPTPIHPIPTPTLYPTRPYPTLPIPTQPVPIPTLPLPYTLPVPTLLYLYPTLPYPTLPVPYPTSYSTCTLPYLILLYLCPSLPYPTLPYHTLPYPTLTYPTQPYSIPYALPCPALPCLGIHTHAHNQASRTRATLSWDSSYSVILGQSHNFLGITSALDTTWWPEWGSNPWPLAQESETLTTRPPCPWPLL